jgi:glycerophosphoryl diester phosphodiesterase
VTDVKGDNLGVLAHVANSRDLLPRIVPQIYSFAEYRPVRALGFSRVFLTLYRVEWGTWSVLRFLRSHPVAGLVCEPARVRRGGLGLRARALGVPVFAHTVNDPDEVAALERLGVAGVYTDHLAP